MKISFNYTKTYESLLSVEEIRERLQNLIDKGGYRYLNPPALQPKADDRSRKFWYFMSRGRYVLPESEKIPADVRCVTLNESNARNRRDASIKITLHFDALSKNNISKSSIVFHVQPNMNSVKFWIGVFILGFCGSLALSFKEGVNVPNLFMVISIITSFLLFVAIFPAYDYFIQTPRRYRKMMEELLLLTPATA